MLKNAATLVLALVLSAATAASAQERKDLQRVSVRLVRDRLESHQLQPVLGQRPGLVAADRGYGSERFDAR